MMASSTTSCTRTACGRSSTGATSRRTAAHLFAFLHPFNFYEFASTRASLASLFLTFSIRAYRKLREIEASSGTFDLVHDNQTLGYGCWR